MKVFTMVALMAALAVAASAKATHHHQKHSKGIEFGIAW